jgi:hypothetical protein
VIEATAQVIGTFAKLIRHPEHGEPDPCPRCESYRMRQDIETDEEQMGFWESEVCASCGWQSEPEFTSFHDHSEGTDVPATSPAQASGSDRLHPGPKQDRRS